MTPTLDGYLADQDPDAVRRLLTFRTMVTDLGDDIEERVHRTEVAWARTRVFAAAFIYSSRLEVAVDLLRRVHHPQLRDAFPTTQKVVTHRLTITEDEQLDDVLAGMLAEAYESVGPGTR
ncbi:hypothetical protein G4H71_01280 [Rhodococcus triatomae]|uniref:DUF5655 domain-containing protein n=1 Tax=Rhodococcus triatomae TaxID=300028 RepID=A0A1G8DCT0_9NOCA|nr:DUF5655 domain-containing protein [Rhodococcus triatomae]QNG21269.1 hypothetical protein G4H72_06770 [Rhodococcus triatomae]QNG25443.1 hypothetical protein G4H71_01280 [Rhodococcus triatomae]SDH55209.1 hypothetical protein SAMN05444695_102262 [Rhodococcus triatomae]